MERINDRMDETDRLFLGEALKDKGGLTLPSTLKAETAPLPALEELIKRAGT